MASQHAGHPFSARVPAEVLARFRAKVAENGDTQTAVLVAFMQRYADGDTTTTNDEESRHG